MRSQFRYIQLLTSFLLVLSSINGLCQTAGNNLLTELESFKTAFEVVSKSAKVMGTDSLVKIKQLSYELSGSKYMDGQSLSFGKAEVSLPASQMVSIDFEKNWFVNETIDRYLGGYLFHFRSVYLDTVAFSYEVPKIRFNSLTVLPVAGKNATRLQLLRLLPVYVIKAAMDNRSSLRYVGMVKVGPNWQHKLSFIYSNGLLMQVLIDYKTNILTSYSFISANEIDGDVVMDYSFADYHSLHGILFPKKRMVSNQLKKLRDETVSVMINQPIAPERFNQPLDYNKAVTMPMAMKEVAKNIYLIENVNGYNVMCLNYTDHLMVLEAVGGSADVVKLIESKFPGKPIKYLAISHYHEDHSKGLPFYINKGVTVISGKDNIPYVNYLGNYNSHVLLSGLPKQKPKLKAIGEREVFEDENLRMEMINFGPNLHANELYVYYFPKENIIFQADFLISTDQGKIAKPIIPINREFFTKLDSLGIKPLVIYGVHLKPVPFKDFELALQQEGGK